MTSGDNTYKSTAKMTVPSDMFTNRELSWLDFNERVLREALDKDNNPLLERLKFVSIFSSNLDEFFMVRVSAIREQINANYTKKDFSGYTPQELFAEIFAKAKKLSKLQQEIFAELKLELKRERILFPDMESDEFREILESIFLDEIMPVISPVVIDVAHPFPFIYGRRLCLIVELSRKGEDFFSLIIIPETLRRVYRINRGRAINIFIIEDIIKSHLTMLYKGYEVKSVSTFRLTRDADLEVTEEESADLLKSIQYSLSQRKRGDVNRIEVSKDISLNSVNFLKEMIDFTEENINYIEGPIDLTFLLKLTEFKKSLMFPALEHRPIQRVTDRSGSLFDIIKERTLFFHRPYQSFSVVSDLIAEAATDPNVLAIKMTLYRANSNSQIIASLLEAAHSGKQVSVVVELKARFDEERNIGWAKDLEEAGCLVTYGLVGLKVHAKCMLIVRKERNRIVRYTHIATGNYNEDTANLYTDIDMITAEERLGNDATKLFNYLTGFTEEDGWSRMVVAPFDMRDKIESLIDSEIDFANAGKEAHIIIKANSFIDKDMIIKLYQASNAGVKVDLIVRGICGLRPGVKEFSENIRVVSIVGRFLEHSRVLYFKHGGDSKYYIASADIMPRNLNGRVEIMVSVEDKVFKTSLGNYLNTCLRDNCKAWELKGGTYSKVKRNKGDEVVCAQMKFLNNEI